MSGDLDQSFIGFATLADQVSFPNKIVETLHVYCTLSIQNEIKIIQFVRKKVKVLFGFLYICRLKIFVDMF